jgi:hypothetical protein
MAPNPMIIRVGATLDDLRAQLKAGKIDITQFVGGVEQLADRMTGTATPSFDKFTQSLDRTDRVLNAAGVSTSREMAALRELSSAATMTAGELGGITTAGLAVAAALGGWQIGRRISEMLGLDEIIGNATASLLGFSPAAEAAGAKADVLAKASRTAGVEIKDMALAMAINEEHAIKMRQAAQEANDAIARLDAPRKSAEMIAKWNDELRKVADGGVLNALRDDIDSHNFSVSTLATNYRISADAVGLLTRQMKEEDEAHKKNADTIERTQEALDKWHDTVDAVEIGTGNFRGVLESIDGTIVEWAEHLLASGVSAQKVGEYYALTGAQVRALDTDLKAKTKATDAAAEADKKAAEAAAKLREEMDAEAQAVLAAFDAMNSEVVGIDVSFGGWNSTVMGTLSMLDSLKLSADDTSVKIRTLSGEIVSVAEAQQRFSMGNSVTYDLSNQQGIAEYRKQNPAANITWSDSQIIDFVRAGGNLQQLINQGIINPYAGYTNTPGRASGGPVDANQPYMVGERGPELFVPRVAGGIVPSGGAGGALVTIQAINVTQPLGTPAAIAKAVDEAMVRSLRSRGLKFTPGVGTAGAEN